MSQVEENELVACVLEWIRENRVTSRGEAPEIIVAEDVDLISNGLLDSIGLVNLIAFVEKQSGCKIDLTDAEPEDICIARNLCKIALRDNAHSDRGTNHDQSNRRDILSAS